MDLLGVDADEVFTIVELKVKKDDDHLKQALRMVRIQSEMRAQRLGDWEE